MTAKLKYIISDSQNIPLAHATLESPVDAAVWQVRVLEGGVPAVMEQEYVRMVGMSPGAKDVTGRILSYRGDMFSLEPGAVLGEEIRQNLRVSVRFDSYLYPVTGSWTGRRRVVSNDLSCGGIAFFCGQPLERGEQVEVVIPITSQPLLVHAQILRPKPSTGALQLYAAKFVGLVEGEETMLREAVFGQQIQNRGDRVLPPT